MKKIGILTFHKSVNYGSVLQAFSLKETLRTLGYDVEVIDYQPDNYNHMYGLFRKPTTPYRLKYNTINLLHAGVLTNRKKLFAQFREQHLNLSPEKYTFGDDMSPLSEKYDAIVCGSDQIWNPKSKDSDINYYLPIPHTLKKISYAVSLNDGFSDEFKDPELYKKLLSDFDRLAVREQTAKEQLEAFLGTNDNVKVVLDPSLLHEKEDFDSICAPDRVGRPFIFLYSVHHNPTTQRAAQTLSKRLSMPVYFLYTDINSYKTEKYFKDFCYPKRDTSPTEFIGFVKNASLIVTDSFHGTAFSLVFEKPFFSIKKSDDNGVPIRDKRIGDSLKKLGVEWRYISEEEAATVDLEKAIDYAAVGAKRRELVKDSLAYLKEAIG